MTRIRLWTQQGHGFDLTSGRIDLSRSQYATMVGYADKIGELARLVGTDQFIWCIDETDEFAFARPEPMYEHLIAVERDRILGYVRNDAWSAYIHGGERADVFSKTRPAGVSVSSLVGFPLSRAELIDKWDLSRGKRRKDWRGGSPAGPS